MKTKTTNNRHGGDGKGVERRGVLGRNGSTLQQTRPSPLEQQIRIEPQVQNEPIQSEHNGGSQNQHEHFSRVYLPT